MGERDGFGTRNAQLAGWLKTGAFALVVPLELDACRKGAGAEYSTNRGPAIGTQAASDQDGFCRHLTP